MIKSHHNVGGLPDYVDFKEIIEPFVTCSKMRFVKLVLSLEFRKDLVFRQPFPGPGLGIRIIGEVTAEKVRIVQDADAIYREEIAKQPDLIKNGGPSWMPPVLRSTYQYAKCRRYG